MENDLLLANVEPGVKMIVKYYKLMTFEEEVGRFSKIGYKHCKKQHFFQFPAGISTGSQSEDYSGLVK